MDQNEVQEIITFMNNLRADLEEVVDKLEALDIQFSPDSIKITSTAGLATLEVTRCEDIRFTHLRSGTEFHHSFQPKDLLAVGKFLVDTYGGAK